MRIFVGILCLTAVGSASAGVIGGLVNGLLSANSLLGSYGFGYDPYQKVHQGGSIFSIPGDIIQATKILFRSIWKIMTGRIFEGIGDLFKNGFDVLRNIFRDIIGKPHGIDPSLQECPGQLVYNPTLNIWECYSYGGSSWGTGYTPYQTPYQTSGYLPGGIRYQAQGYRSKKN